MLKILESYLLNKLYPAKERSLMYSCSSLILIILGSISIFAGESLLLLYLVQYVDSIYSLELSKSAQMGILGIFYLAQALVIFTMLKGFYQAQENSSQNIISKSIAAFLQGYKNEGK